VDVEGSFFTALLRSGQLQALGLIVRDHLTDHYRGVYDWTLEFLRTNGVMPRWETADSTFPRLLTPDAPEDPTWYAGQIRENALRIAMEDGFQEHVVNPLSESKATMALDGAHKVLADLNRTFRSNDQNAVLEDIGLSVSARMADYRLRKAAEGVLGYPWPWAALTRATGGLQPGDVAAFLARSGVGKAQPLDARVLTPRGWRRMGDLVPGDVVASVDGTPSSVLGVYPQGVRQVYRVSFNDGRSTETCAEHLWRVHSRASVDLMTTADVAAALDRGQRLWVDAFDGDFGVDASLPVRPWVLGALLGDGGLTGSTLMFSNADAAVLQRMRDELAEGPVVLKHYSNYDYALTVPGGTRGGNPMIAGLRALGLWGLASHEKFVPRQYLEAPRQVREAVLSGLLDTDGHVGRENGSITFTSTSEQLVRDVVCLARSLGAWASMRRRATPRYTHNDETRDGRPAYVCGLSGAVIAHLITHTERRERALSRDGRAKRLAFEAVTPTRMTATQCIAVSHSSRLYITDDFIVTHNTWGMVLAAVFLWQRKLRVLFGSMETPPSSKKGRDTKHRVVGGICLYCYQRDQDPTQECPAAAIPRQRLTVRFDAVGARLSAWRLWKGCLTPPEERKLERYYAACAEPGRWGSLKIIAPPVLSNIVDMELAILQYQPDVVFWDSAYLAIDKGKDRRDDRAGQFVIDVKRLAERMSVPIITSWHFNRDVDEKATDASQGSAALSDEVARVWDTLIGLFRPPELEDAGEGLWRALKTRDGVRMSGLKTHFKLVDSLDFREIGTGEEAA
jgi:hypothetical protein